MKLKPMAILLAGLLAFMVFGGANDCTEEAQAVERRDTIQVGEQQDIYQKGQPVPLFNYSQTRATLIEVYKAKTAGTGTYTVVFSFGKPVFVCPSIGFPIPATTQLTNPNMVRDRQAVVAQAEPDGTFTGTTAATYVLCVRDDGTAAPIYAETDVMAFTYPVVIVDGMVVDAKGKSTVTVDTKKP